MAELRASNICGSMNGMYFMQQNKLNESRFIRVQGQSFYAADSTNQITSCLEENFDTQIQISSFVAWGLLCLSVILDAFVPCWLMGDVKSQSLTRNSWRFLTVSMLIVPFVLYEQRNVKQQKHYFYNSLTKQNLKPIFVSTINFCLWLICLIYACKFTSMNHAVCLSALKFYFASIIKIKNGEKFHEFEIAGNILCTIGTALILTDSITLPQVFDQQAERYLRVDPWKRLFIGDALAIVGSIVSVFLDQNHKVPDMPRFSYLFLYNLFLCFNLITSGYFFGGSQFSNNIKFGVFGLFTYANFVSVFYVSVMLGLYLMLANVLIAQIFNDVIINVATSFQIILTTMIYHILRLQLIPSGMTCLGYSFLIPGLIFVIGGQGALENVDNKINFQLYRPTQIRNTRMTGFRQTLQHSLSMERANNTQQMSPTLSPAKGPQKMPFQMILEEDEPQNKYTKNK